ncbi:MAG: D-2-hydroxyacid dehydrogenase [Lachnospiraceae bacterium]|nr:D-2-hydroxyacid dehydrogenase [Lachnospiraceae bacterium]
MKIVILERNSVGTDVSMDAIMALGDVTAYENTSTPEEVVERVKDADIIIANKSPLNENTLSEAHNVKLICEFATGFDNVDISYCRKRNIKVSNVVDYSTDAVAQHTFALLFYVLEKLKHYDEYVKGGEYASQTKFSNFDLPFCEIAGKTWGIIGMGNIGQKVAKIAKAFGCRVIFHSITGKSKVSEYEQVDFEELLAKSDILSLHCPLSDLSRGLINSESLSKMKKTAVLINVARGAIVNDADLAEALNNNIIAAAGLDVTGTEPMRNENPLSKIMDSNRLIITPHLGWASTEARNRCVSETVKNIKAFQEGTGRNYVWV